MFFESGLARARPLYILAAFAALSSRPSTGKAEASRACGAASLTDLDSPAAATSLEIRRGPGFALVRGADSHAEGACAPGPIAQAVLRDLAETVARSLDVDPTLAVVLTSEPGSCSSIYYAALANDVRGIGYQHTDAREIFDDTPDSALEGVAFLNDWPYWREHPQEFSGAFDHELGHRWGARVHARFADPATGSSALLGREDEHWSYLLDTSGSPLEGNVWVGVSEGFESRTPAYPTRFSQLDLYLMGAVAASEVPEFLLLAGATFDADDCRGQPIGPDSPPQSCGAVSARGDAIRVSIDDIIAVEGPRQPSPSSAARSFGVLAIVLESAESAIDVETCAEVSTAVTTRLAEFETASSGHVRLENVLGQGEACDAMCGPSTETAVPASACEFRPQRRLPGSWAALFLIALVLRRRRG
jgi:hypothetical protein